MAILKAKAERDGIGLPNDVAQYLAQRIEANVRELEGALIRLSAFASFRRRPLTVDFASEILKGLFEQSNQPASVERLFKSSLSTSGRCERPRGQTTVSSHCASSQRSDVPV